MALIVEDGTGKSDAESYASVAQADQYHVGLGNSDWSALDTTQKEQALRRASEYLQQVYAGRWAGYRTTDAQALDWPRSYVPREATASGTGYYPSNQIPVDLIKASAELALKSRFGPLLPDIDRISKREKVDVLEVEYMPNQSPVIEYPAIDRMLARLLVGGPNGGATGGFRAARLVRQ